MINGMWQMRRWGLWGVAGAVLALGSEPAKAQDINSCASQYCERRLAAGTTMDFQWLNYDEATCTDRGPPRLVVTAPPRLGRWASRRTAVTQTSGTCAGKKLSLLLVTYTAGRTPGQDKTSFKIVGQKDIVANVNFTIY